MRKLHKAGLERKQAVWGGHVNVCVYFWQSSALLGVLIKKNVYVWALTYENLTSK
jgi:hypothetical protein